MSVPERIWLRVTGMVLFTCNTQLGRGEGGKGMLVFARMSALLCLFLFADTYPLLSCGIPRFNYYDHSLLVGSVRGDYVFLGF